MVNIDQISGRLPKEINMSWQRIYRDLNNSEKMKPFGAFLRYLRKERAAVIRMTECAAFVKRKCKPHNAESHATGGAETSRTRVCVIHGQGHTTTECKVFTKLAMAEKYNKIREKRLCFNCFGKHFSKDCRALTCNCGKSHHHLLCTEQKKPLVKSKRGVGQLLRTRCHTSLVVCVDALHQRRHGMHGALE